jgi:hypothetical protein
VANVDGRANTVQLFSRGNIVYYPTIGGTSTVVNKTLAGNDSYGSTFGPQVWSRPFVANDSQAVSFEWKAQGGSDDYEVYGFLVRIDAQANCTSSSDYGSNSTHTVLTHGRGLTRAWTTTTGNIGTNGCYRFRMVGGTYDASGGFSVGASFYIANATLGDAQVITFTQPSDVTGSTSQTLNISVSSNAGDAATAAITLTSTDTNVCTLSSQTSRTVTVLANQAGNICSIRADSAASGSFGAATSITR